MLHSSLANYSISELASTGSGLNDLVDNDGNDAETAASQQMENCHFVAWN